MRNKVPAVIAAFVGSLLTVAAHLAQAQAPNEGMGVLARPTGSGGELADPAAPTEADIIKALTPQRRTRGLSAPTRSISVEPGKEREALERGDLPKLDLRIEFEFNSDRITASSKQALASLGLALKDPQFGSNRFVIAGHTDGRGSEQYNQQLSERRAAAVKDYLVRNAGIEEARLIAIGFGKSKPRNAADPLSAENRRVEIVNLLN